MAKHARLGCSDTRWPHCPGSIRECAQYPDTTSKAAIDGTGSHELLELALTKMVHAHEFIGQNIAKGHEDMPGGWLVNETRANRVQIALDYVYGKLNSFGEKRFLETEGFSDPGIKYGREDWWGTCDVTLFHDGVLEVIDYKDGFTYVNENTTQLIGYSIGKTELYKHLGVHTVIKTIIQPKTSNPIRSVTHSVEVNDMLGQTLANAAILTDDPNASLVSGDHCKWCDHKPNCEARNKQAVATINGPTDPRQMTAQQLADAMDAIPLIETFLDGVEKEAKIRINNNVAIPGYAMVEGSRPHAKWIDTESALKKLTTMGFKLAERLPSTPITPAQALKREGLTKSQIKRIERLIVRDSGKLKLKKVSQKNRKDLFQDMPVKKLISLTEFTTQQYRDLGWTDQQLIDNKFAKWES